LIKTEQKQEDQEMDVNTVTGARRAKLIKMGKGWGSPQVKAQANMFLGSFKTHQTTLERHGLLSEDVVELAGWVAMYPEQQEEREDKQLGNKLTSRLLQSLMKEAESARRLGRLRLGEAEPRLKAVEGEENKALQQVQEVLSKTARKPQDDPGALAAQLRLLAGALRLAEVLEIARRRGGEEALAGLERAEAALSEAVAEMEQRTSTKAQTEALDLLDGLIVERLREIGRVAKEAAKREGSPALAEAFQMKLLYG
jgi:hypothetical protein